MARSYRNPPEKRFYRKMRTTNEIKQNEQLFADIRSGDVDYEISGMNRMRRHIPNAWDDVFISDFD